MARTAEDATAVIREMAEEGGMTAEFCEVVITAPNADWLATFTRSLVDDRLVACGHNLAAIRSIYRWQGAVHDEREARVAFTPAQRWCRSSLTARTATTRTKCPVSSRCRSLLVFLPTCNGCMTKRPTHHSWAPLTVIR